MFGCVLEIQAILKANSIELADFYSYSYKLLELNQFSNLVTEADTLLDY